MRDDKIIPPLLVDRREAARLLAVCDRTIDAMIRAGELPAVRVGRAVRIDVADLRRWIEQRKLQPAAEFSIGA